MSGDYEVIETSHLDLLQRRAQELVAQGYEPYNLTMVNGQWVLPLFKAPEIVEKAAEPSPLMVEMSGMMREFINAMERGEQRINRITSAPLAAPAMPAASPATGRILSRGDIQLLAETLEEKLHRGLTVDEKGAALLGKLRYIIEAFPE